MILETLEFFFPGWSPPPALHDGWVKCECPVHDDDNPSASLNLEAEAFVCHGCGYSGDYIKIIEQEEGCSYAEAIKTAERIAEQRGVEVPRSPGRKPRRRVSRAPRFQPL
ncbi:CHC2 zinc finger domain-containing protein [Corynebacterium sp. NML120713]|uniref:CHC2 zinc finger domain-containing protein n=1 Tax=Corynebacterium sp. NML120713 TaxID=1906332 RepID=UPI003515C82F